MQSVFEVSAKYLIDPLLMVYFVIYEDLKLKKNIVSKRLVLYKLYTKLKE